MYQPRRHLSQMHTTNCMPFIRGKDGFLKKKSETMGLAAAPSASPVEFSDLQRTFSHVSELVVVAY